MSTATRTPRPTDLPTAPLPPTAHRALSRLDSAFAGRTVSDQLAHEAGTHVRVTPAVQRAVVRYEIASSRTAELSAFMDLRDLTGAEFDAFELAQDTMREAVATLTAAGMLHLIEVAS